MSRSSSPLDAPSRYAPVAVYQHDPDACRQMLKVVERQGVINPLEAIGPSQIRDWVETFDDLARVVGFLAMDGESSTMWARFWRGPRQIFDISGPLVPEFEGTDVDDVPLSALKEPYPELYLHFGPNTTAAIRYPKNPVDVHEFESFRLDGAYIRVHREQADDDILTQMDICFTTKWTGGSVNSPVPPGVAEPVFTAEISGYDSEPMRIGSTHPRWGDPLQKLETVGDGIRDGMESVYFNARQSDIALRNHALGLKNQIPRIRGAVGPVTLYEDHARTVRPILTAGIRLVVNALFFLCSYPQRQSRQIDPSAPQDLVERMKRAQSRGEARSTESLLRERGFSYVTLASHPDGAETQQSGSRGAGGTVSPHLRRGHWRHQRVGAKLASIRLTWVRPAFVGTNAEETANGRSYIVSPPRDPSTNEG